MIQSNQSWEPMGLPSILRRDAGLTAGQWRGRLSWFARMFMTEARELPVALTDGTFAEFVRSRRHAVVHFWAPWNERDSLMKRLLAAQVPGDLRRQIAFASVDIDLAAHHELGRQHKVFDVPFLAYYRCGVLARTTTGMQTRGAIVKCLRELVGPPGAS
jgi:hypothetical protein